MANAWYNDFKRALQEKELDVKDDGPKVSLIDGADYTFSASHTSYASDVGSGAKVAAASLSTPSISGSGVFDSDDWVWTAVTGDPSEIIVLWLDTPSSPVADPLMAYFDTGMTGMPVTPGGGDINGTVHGSGWWDL